MSGNGEVQNKGQEAQKVKEGQAEAKSRKTEKEFVDDLVTGEVKLAPDKLGNVTVDGAFPQVAREPKFESINGMKRITR